nr:hypothetical protein Iba_chr06aCG15340 [Ipomoea batatas]
MCLSRRRQVAAKEWDADQRNNNGKSGGDGNGIQPRSPFSVADGRVGGDVLQRASPCALPCHVRGSKPKPCGGGCAEEPGGVLPSVGSFFPSPSDLSGSNGDGFWYCRWHGVAAATMELGGEERQQQRGRTSPLPGEAMLGSGLGIS